MNNPNAADNLKPFKKGDDSRRNLKGRPKLPDLNEAMANVLGDDKAIEKIIAAMEAKAKRGDVRAAELLLDRAYGKVRQDIKQEGTAQIVIKVVEDDGTGSEAP